MIRSKNLQLIDVGYLTDGSKRFTGEMAPIREKHRFCIRQSFLELVKILGTIRN